MKPTPHLRLLTRAYLLASGAPRPLRVILNLCYLGISIGALSLMMALIITRGFERDIGAKMKGINSDAIITSPGNQLDSTHLKERINQIMGHYVSGMSGSSTRYVMLERNNRHQVLFMRGLNPTDEAATTILPKKIIAPKGFSLHHLLTTQNSVIIGSTLATNNRICCGDQIIVHAPQQGSGRSLSLTEHPLTVTGVFSTGLDEYDTNGAFCSEDTMKTLFTDMTGVDQLAVSFAPRPQPSNQASWWRQLRGWFWHYNESAAHYSARQLRKLKLLLTGLQVRGWHELYPDLVASLTLEKYAMSIVLGLIALVASMLMICLLFMFLQYKRQDIAILRALGASNDDIYRLFRRIGMMIVLRATLTGLTIAALIGYWLEAYKPIKLPGVYIVTYLPAAVEPMNFVVIFLITFVLGYLACLIPLRQLHTMSVAGILRES